MTYWISLLAINRREFNRFIYQRGRFFAALVRPLLWLLVFAAGFRAATGMSIIAPYVNYILYEIYIVPGLCGMIFLFNGMQSALALVYDREMGSMRILLTAPLPRSWILFSKLIASSVISVLQAYIFLGIAWIFGIELPVWGYVLALPFMFLFAMMLGAFGLFISSTIKQLENFAGVMNFIIFPMFFLSTALYPVWKMREGSPLIATICKWNPFSQGIELIRFAMYSQMNWLGLAFVVFFLVLFMILAVRGYDPTRSLFARSKGKGAG